MLQTVAHDAGRRNGNSGWNGRELMAKLWVGGGVGAEAFWLPTSIQQPSTLRRCRDAR